MKRVMAPAITLMNRLRVPQKFAVLALMGLFALAGVGYSLYGHLSRLIVISEGELEG